MLTLGLALMAVTQGAGAYGFDGASVLAAVASCVVLHRLAHDPHPRRDERRITALAITGRGVLIALLAQLGAHRLGWPAAAGAVAVGWIVALAAVQAWTMLRHGPRPRLFSSDLPTARPVVAALRRDTPVGTPQ